MILEVGCIVWEKVLYIFLYLNCKDEGFLVGNYFCIYLNVGMIMISILC